MNFFNLWALRYISCVREVFGGSLLARVEVATRALNRSK